MANHQKGSQRGPAPRTGHANYTTVEEIPTGEEVLAGTFFLNEHPVINIMDYYKNYLVLLIVACSPLMKIIEMT
jgi:hypothetical protein